MKYVLDSRVAIKWVLPEQDTPKAVMIRSGFRQGLHEFLAPDIYPVEIAHAIGRAERRGLILPSTGVRRLGSALRYSPDLHPYLPLLPRAFAISSSERGGVYGCLYVALAEREGCALLSADDRLFRALQPTVSLHHGPGLVAVIITTQRPLTSAP
jgi:predicted nucleic acid-binding protein